MQLNIIPTSNFPNYTELVVLGGVSYNLEFVWNSRFEFWTMNIQNADGDDLINGIKLVLNYELISNFSDRDLPIGEIWVLDVTGNNAPIGRDDFENGRLLIVFKSE